MSGGKWTPGEWRVGKAKPSFIDGRLMYSIEGPVIVGDYEDWGFTEDDARLIAAAPKLYAELARLVAALEPLELNGGWPLDSAGVATLNKARAALALAEGTPP